MHTLILMAGIPGSGKSTWCKKYQKEHPNVFIVDTDETRKKITGSYLVFPSKMEIIFDEMIRETNEIFKAYEGQECTVIEDSIFLDDYRREYYMERIHGYDKAILFMVKMHDYSICYKQNKMRPKEKWVPEDVMDHMREIYVDPSPKVRAYFDEVRVEWWN